MLKSINTLLLAGLALSAFGQDAAGKSELPYRAIPDHPSEYTAATVAARVVDGVGFRYYWASEGLREDDLKYKPNEDARTTHETLIHIYELSLVLANSVKSIPNEGSSGAEKFSFDELREKTLDNIKQTSDILKSSSDSDLKNFKMVFKRGESSVEFPFWNELNGPISDALWHIGQVVSFRRSSGNPFNSNVSVLQGKVRE
jgi:hypothetical protein